MTAMRGPDTSPAGVSVVIPVKDRAGMLAETLRSVAAQTVQPAEVIVVDDGSSDDSASVAERAGATVLRTPAGPVGPSAARNLALEGVRTELVCALDSDDLLLPRMLERLAAALRESPESPFAFARALIASREAGEWRPRGVIGPREGELEHPLGALYARNFVPSCAVVARTAAVREVGAYSLASWFMEDHHLWVRLAGLGVPAFVPEILSVYREHPGNRHDPVRMRAATEAITDLAADDPRLREFVPERRGTQFVDLATAALRRRQPITAARAAWALVLKEGQRRRTLAAAVRHWRGRRRTADAALEEWRADTELRALLASYR